MSINTRLVQCLNAACPVAGVDIGAPGDPASVRIDYGDGATLAQRKAAIDALAAFDWSAETQQAWERGRSAVAAITMMATSYEPLSFTDRVISDAIWTALNDVREALKLPRILKPEIVQRLITSAMTGGGDPAVLPAAK